MDKILVVYASVTGNTEMMAEIIISSLKKYDYDIDIKIFDEDKINARDLANYDAILMGLYTWSGGELPFEVEEFYDELTDIDLTGKICGVFGSGDQFYDEFCGAVDLMYEQFEESGATMIPIKVKVDMDPEGEEITECEHLAEAICERLGELV